jgi:cellulose synthase/poly-beta-1,6-N-acetylglucosamine synthase-like glycosyltransferase
MMVVDFILWLVFGLSGVALVVAFIGYPLLSQALARRRPVQLVVSPAAPRVTVLVAARNEEASIAARLDNLCELDYPDLDIVIVSDGSHDATAEIAARYAGPGVKVVRASDPVGKTAALNAAIADLAERPDVFVFSDATARWAPDTLKNLVWPFGDPSVGAVSGLVQYDYPDRPISQGFRLYQRLVVASRATDGVWGSVTSVSGSISAVRADLWEPPAADLSYDLVLPALASAAGQRSVLVADAISLEEARDRASREYRSRVRLALSAYTFIRWLSSRRKTLTGGYPVQVFCHKVLRWCAPALLVLFTLASTALGVLLPAAAVGAGVLLGLMGLVPRVGRWFSAPLYALTVAWAYLIGLLLFLGGSRVAGWEPSTQR